MADPRRAPPTGTPGTPRATAGDQRMQQPELKQAGSGRNPGQPSSDGRRAKADCPQCLPVVGDEAGLDGGHLDSKQVEVELGAGRVAHSAMWTALLRAD